MNGLAAKLTSAALWVANLMTALVVVVVSFECRLLSDQFMDLKSTQQKLQVEWGRLLLEESTLAANIRVEDIAKSRLAMRRPRADEIQVVGQ